MGADRSRSRSRSRTRLGQAVAVLMALCAFMAGGAGAHGLITGAVESPKTVRQCQQKYRHNAKARTACIKRSQKATKPSSGGNCTLETSGGNTGSESGDTKDYSVKVEALGDAATGQPFQLVAVITIHKSGITICSATLTGVLPVPGAFGSHGEQLYKKVAYPLTVSPRGGRSRPVTVPWDFYVPVATVKARLTQK